MKKEKGITLIALVVMVVILIILLGVSIGSGSQSIRDVRLKSFYMQLELIQKRVDVIATTNETYLDNNEKVLIQQQGYAFQNLIPEKQTKLLSVLESENIDANAMEFRYFTNEQLKRYIIDLEDFGDSVYIHFNKRIIIADKGITLQNKTYHTLDNKTYYATYNANKNIGTIDSLSYAVSAYGNNTYKVVITPSNQVGDIQGIGSVKYKKVTTQYWETSNNNSIILEPAIEYQIIYTDAANVNSIEKTIKVVASLLPTSYQQVEYIESTGTQYINTQVIPNVNLNGEFTLLTNTGAGYPFGSTNGQNTDYWGINLYSSNKTFECYWGTGSYPKKGSWDYGNRYRIRINNKKFYCNDTLLYDFASSTNTYSFNTTNPIFLFGLNYQGGVYRKFRFYTAKFWNGEQMIRNYIPCYCTKTVTDVKGNTCAAGTIGMYDLVTNQFYTNDGTGTFEKGNDVIENNLHVEEVI